MLLNLPLTKTTPYLSIAIAMLAGVLIITACSTSSQPQQQEEITENSALPVRDFIFGDEQPFPQCHASTLLRSTDGQFLVAWFGGTEEKDDDVGIWLSRGRPDQWSKPQAIAKLRDDPHWNPVLFQSPAQSINLFFKVGNEIDHWETWVNTSTNG
ncbi:MAG: exo-alpha-sialidase, partial [Cyclobacteriaceae bacterium]